VWLFFQLIGFLYEQGSVVVISNLPFGRWGESVSADVVAAAMIDRLVHHAEVLTLTGDSYRTRQRRELLIKQNRAERAWQPSRWLSGLRGSAHLPLHFRAIDRYCRCSRLMASRR